MSDVTQILSQIDSGDPSAADQLLPLIYTEIRRLAVQKMAQENPGQTLQATALVHEAYLRLVDGESARNWENHRITLYIVWDLTEMTMEGNELAAASYSAADAAICSWVSFSVQAREASNSGSRTPFPLAASNSFCT